MKQNVSENQLEVHNGIVIGFRPYKASVDIFYRGLKAGKLYRYAMSEEEAEDIIQQIKKNPQDIANYKLIADFGPVNIEKTEDLVINTPSTVIGKKAFEGKGLKSVIIPDHIRIIGASAFKNNHLKQIILPTSLGTIGEEAFASNDLEKVVIPSKVTSIWQKAFKDNNISDINFSNKSELTYIGENAFAGNPIESITLPRKVDRFYRAFDEETEVTTTVYDEGKGCLVYKKAGRR